MLNTLILCPTARLARSIQSDIAAQQMQAGKTSWQSAPVLTLAQWLDDIVEAASLSGKIGASKQCLNAFNEQLLWQEVINTSLKKNAFGALFDVAGLATAAMEANQYVIAWKLHIPRDQQAEESRQFLHWQRAFQARCEALNALESVRYFDWQLEMLKTDALEANIHAGCRLIQFAGFDQTAPQETRLREILKRKNFEVAEYVATRQKPAQTQHVQLENVEAECRAAAAWAKQQLDANPEAKLAIVAPQLNAIRNQLASLLDDTFYPESARLALAGSAPCYNFSLGTPLIEQPMIQAALNLLQLFSGYQLQQTEISSILLSPFWSASHNEADSRAILDAKMREYLPAQLTLHQLIEFAKHRAENGLNIHRFLADLQAAKALISSKKSTASEMTKLLGAILEALQWPGERSATSLEYQTANAWQKALQQLKKLDLLNENLSFVDAVRLMQQICSEQVFQAESEKAAAIQILGAMEALSKPVDAMWVMQMNDHIWPPPARPNPLLPAFIQRAAHLPNADNSVQAAFAATVQQRLLHSASTIIFSSSQMESNSQLRASPFMRNIQTLIDLSSTPVPLAATLAEQLSALGNAGLTHLDDHLAPAVRAGEHVSGGTSLFRAQAICPAWAFYQFRLGAKALKTPSSGLDSMARGILVHAVLAAFWGNLHFADLRDMSETDFSQALNIAVSSALRDFANDNQSISKTVLALEHERLYKLIGDWLAYEKTRAIPFNILACEADKKVMIRGIEVSLIIDRIHALEGGGIEFIDYKTGQKPDTRNWAESRITEPQLPIYAVFYDANFHVTGVQFGMVKTMDHAFSGVSEVDFEAEIEKRKPKWLQQFADWPTVLNHWEASIEAIAEEIKAGEAATQFNDAKDLAYCEVLPLLRLPELQLQFERFRNEGAKP